MLAFLQIYFLASSMALFFYALSSDKAALMAFGYGLILNIYPLFWMPNFSMDLARIAGVPLAYVPILAAGLALLLRSKPNIKQKHRGILSLALLFIIYTFMNTFINGFSFSNFAYWFAWVLNFFIFFAAANFFSTIPLKTAQKVIKSTITILVIGAVIGIVKFFIGISDDANFMPVMNRNGTVVFIVMLLPLVFYLNTMKTISNKKAILFFGIIFTALIFTFSRSGIIGAMMGIVLYYLKLTPKNIVIVTFIFMVSAGLFFVGSNSLLVKRMAKTAVTIEKIVHSDEIIQGQSDYNRIKLMQAAIDISKQNFWFGAGLGLKNYQREFHKVSNHPRDSKAHNFYLSYFAELGLIGFIILISFFVVIFNNLAPLKSKYRTFKVTFICIAVMMTMNEYILLPEIWYFLGIMVGISYSYKTTTQIKN